MSINAAFQGRRYKTQECVEYETNCLWFIKGQMIEGEVKLQYKFYLKNYSRTDVGNLEKILTDLLVRKKIIIDDRYVKKIILEKFKSNEDKIEIEILKV